MKRPDKENLTLECQLTDTEKLAYSKKLAYANQRLYHLEDQKKAYNSQIKSDMEKSGSEISYLSQAIDSGKEYRDIECTVEYDWIANQMIWIRIDTGEVAKKEIIPKEFLQESAL